MTQINMHEAKTNFSQLIERAMRGEDIVIARYGKPLLRLVPITSTAGKRASGLNILGIQEHDWFAPMTQSEIAEWYDQPIEPVKSNKSLKNPKSKA
jgi:prevent-host-death family protein